MPDRISSWLRRWWPTVVGAVALAAGTVVIAVVLLTPTSASSFG